jgi:hypothetical protein
MGEMWRGRWAMVTYCRDRLSPMRCVGGRERKREEEEEEERKMVGKEAKKKEEEREKKVRGLMTVWISLAC